MNIIIVSDYAHIEGGASSVAINSAIAFSKHGHNVVFFSSVSPVDANLKINGVKVICIESSELKTSRIRSFFTGLWNFDSASRLNALLKENNRSDSKVFIHSWTKSLSSSIFLALSKSKFDTTVVLHDYFSVCPNGAFFNFKKNTSCNLSPLSLSCVLSNCDSRNYFIKLWRVVRQIIFRIVFNFYSKSGGKLIFVSEFSKKIMHDFLPSKYLSKVSITPVFGLKNLSKINTSKNNLIGFIGRLVDEKGVKFLADTLLPYADRVIFIGGGPLEEYIRNKSQKYTITGWLNQEELNSVCKTLRFNIFSSEIFETDGLVIKEIGRLGIPSIVSNVTAGSNYINSGINGLIYKSNCVNDLKEKIKILDDNDSLNIISIGAYEYFMSEVPDDEKYIEEIIN